MKTTQTIVSLATIVGTLLSVASTVDAHGPSGRGHFISGDITRRYRPNQHKVRTPSAVGNVDPHMYLKQREAGTLPAHFTKRSSNPQGQTEASAAEVDNEQEECTAYDVTAIDDMASSFPTIWDVATIVKGDTEAESVFKAINESGLVADLAIHGTQPASLLGTGLDSGYDMDSDPGCWWTDTKCSTPKHAGLYDDIIACPEPGAYGVSFDDGPNCTHNALYDFWEEKNQKVSLFYIGSNMMDWPLEAQRGLVDGHSLCVHTWSHRYMTALTDEQAFAELWYSLKAFKSILGITPTCWRPPFGDVDDRIRGIAQGLGLRTIIWNADTFDWELEPAGDVTPAELSATYSAIAALATSTGKTGGIIVLEHELNEPIMKFAMDEYPAMHAAWKYMVPLTACLNVTQPYGEEEYIYPNFAEYVAGTTMPQGLPTSSVAISSASFTLQGTVDGGTGHMPTAKAGGPDNSAGASLSATSVSSTTESSKTGSSGTSSATASASSSGSTENDDSSSASTSSAPTSSSVIGAAWTAALSLASFLFAAILL